MEIKHVTERDNRYKQLPFGTVKTVCELKLNRRKRGSRGGQSRNVDPVMFKKPMGVVRKNHRPLPYTSYKVSKHTGKLWLLLMITQSIRNKEDIQSDYMRSEAMDVVIATETWLTNNDRDVVWLESKWFVKDGYQISVRNKSW